MHHSYIDHYSYQSSPIHRLDPRIKIATTIVYTLFVVTLPKYKIAPLIPFFTLPLLLISLSQTPWKFVLKHLVIVSPFILMVALFNPLYDSTPFPFGPWIIRRGWISALTIMVKFCLTMSALLALVSTTPFAHLLRALQSLGFPRILILQLSFLYRYLFITIEEAQKMLRARKARSYGSSLSVKSAFFSGGSLIGTLFFRSLSRAERVYQAMRARGFHGTIVLITPMKTSRADWLFLVVTLAYLAIFWVVGIGGLQ